MVDVRCSVAFEQSWLELASSGLMDGVNRSSWSCKLRFGSYGIQFDRGLAPYLNFHKFVACYGLP